MTIDVIIPAYNCSETIDYLLASIAMQRLSPGRELKVTVVNDCSTDGVDYSAITGYWSGMLDIALINKGMNEGCGQARQTGFDLTDGEYVMFCDADDSLVSPYAIELLADALNGNDIVMGQFAEITADGVVTHDTNFTWCHGKMYRRAFVKDNNVRFNMTRGNEDVGFNVLLSKLTDKIVYIPQIVYSWNNQEGSLVRKDEIGYKCGYGWRDFIENCRWAAVEMMKREVDARTIADFAASMLGRFYFQYAESYIRLPAERAGCEKKLAEYYDSAVRPFVMIGLINYESLQKAYYSVVSEDGKLAIPQFTYREFLNKFGFFEDAAKYISEDKKNDPCK